MDPLLIGHMWSDRDIVFILIEYKLLKASNCLIFVSESEETYSARHIAD